MVTARESIPTMMPKTITSTETVASRPGLLFAALLLLLNLIGCRGDSSGLHDAQGAPASATSTFSVTAWGSVYEVFPELETLSAGETSAAHVHVTALDGFAPLAEGGVGIELRPSDGGSSERFEASGAQRPGVFEIALTPSRVGLFDLFFHIDSELGNETLRGGQVEIGGADSAGGLRRAPAPRGATVTAEPASFLKEQQWRTDFATEWVTSGTLPRSVQGLAITRSPAGRELILTAPVDGVLLKRPWPHIGQEVGSGRTVLQVRPLIADRESLAELEAEQLGLAAQLKVDRADAERQKALFEQAVVSRQAMERAEAVAQETAAHLEAIEQDLRLARMTRTGEADSASQLETLNLRATSRARIASIMATPGQVVEAGDALVRLVDGSGMWLGLALSPSDARSFDPASNLLGLVARRSDGSTVRFSSDEVGFIARSPEVDRHRGTIDLLLAIPADGRLALGEAVEADLLLSEDSPIDGEVSSVVVPTSALIDDGERIVYLQLQGETFVRQPVTVLHSQGDRALVAGLVPGQRVVTRGGNAIRRASLLTGAQSHGHVH